MGAQVAIIRVVIADDSPAILEGISSLIDSSQSFQVVGLASNGAEAVAPASELLPDVIVMDAQMPTMDGIEATRTIKQDHRGVGILFLSAFTDHLKAALTAGADGYLIKDCTPEELLSNLKRIAGLMSQRRGLAVHVRP